jgi:hypothetical protein
MDVSDRQMNDPNGDETMRTLFETELAPGEGLLWTGRPSLRRRLDSATIGAMVAALAWIPFFAWFSIGYMELLAFAPIPFAAAYCLILAVVFLEGTVGYPVRRFWNQRHTRYALTDRRVFEMLTDSKGSKKHLRSDSIELVKEDRIRHHSNGTATIEFIREGAVVWKYQAIPMPETIFNRRLPYLRFVEIEDGQAVHQQFVQAREACLKDRREPR